MLAGRIRLTNVSDSTESSATAGVRARLTRRGCAGSDVGWKDTFFGCDPSFLGLFPNNVSTTPVAISPIYCIWARFVRPTSWWRGGVCCVFLTVASFSGKQMVSVVCGVAVLLKERPVKLAWRPPKELAEIPHY